MQWAELGTRKAEVRGQKTDEQLKIDSAGNIKVVKQKTDSQHEYGVQGQVCAPAARVCVPNRATHDFFALFNWYQRELDSKPFDGFLPVTLDQIMRADVEIFSRAAQMCEESLALTP